jgi:hypothetical protein
MSFFPMPLEVLHDEETNERSIPTEFLGPTYSEHSGIRRGSWATAGHSGSTLAGWRARLSASDRSAYACERFCRSLKRTEFGPN